MQPHKALSHHFQLNSHLNSHDVRKQRSEGNWDLDLMQTILQAS
jgi:hypothetical protein